MNNNKKAYNAPKLTVHGDVEALTQQTATGTHFDITITAGHTPTAQELALTQAGTVLS